MVLTTFSCPVWLRIICVLFPRVICVYLCPLYSVYPGNWTKPKLWGPPRLGLFYAVALVWNCRPSSHCWPPQPAPHHPHAWPTSNCPTDPTLMPCSPPQFSFSISTWDWVKCLSFESQVIWFDLDLNSVWVPRLCQWNLRRILEQAKGLVLEMLKNRRTSQKTFTFLLAYNSKWTLKLLA